MKIIFISDTHNRHDQIIVPDGDVLVHCGDATGRGSITEMVAFNDWMGKQPHAHRIYVPGNHDALPEDDYALAKAVMTNVEMLISEAVVIDGLKFFGHPFTPTFGNWNFMRNRGESMKKKTDLIHADTNILCCHGPAYGILDTVMGRAENLGCRELRDKILEIKPQIVAVGHIHSAHGLQVEHGTLYINAAQLDESYKVGYKPIVVNI